MARQAVPHRDAGASARATYRRARRAARCRWLLSRALALTAALLLIGALWRGEAWLAASAAAAGLVAWILRPDPDPERAKGIVVLDTDTGACRHVPLTGLRPLVTLESIFAAGLTPGELQERVGQRAASVPEGAVARLYLDNVDPDVYRLLDLQAVREAAGAALLLKLEPQFLATTLPAEVVSVNDLGGQWDRYLEGQDLTGLDRDRIRSLGHTYIGSAVETAAEPG